VDYEARQATLSSSSRTSDCIQIGNVWSAAPQVISDRGAVVRVSEHCSQPFEKAAPVRRNDAP
jgi:hypothetical protein